MGKSLAQKIIEAHLVGGRPVPGEEIALRAAQTLNPDSSGTMAYLQFEALGFERVRTEFSICYVDHNTLQTSFESANDHRFLQTFAARHGIWFSKAGNGICHQVHLERFGRPGKLLLGADSHTPTAGALGMLGIAAGGLDLAVAMGGGPFFLNMPRIIRVVLTGRLQPWVAAKDIILELLRRLTVNGGLGCIFEFVGDGLDCLTVYDRATVANMTAELGATSAVFPSDAMTRRFLTAQGRANDWTAQGPDSDATYDGEVTLNLDELEPLIACPHSPDNVVPVRQVAGLPVQQVLVGSCTNSSFKDLMTLTHVLQGRCVHRDVGLAVTPGSRQVMLLLSANGGLTNLVMSGVRLLEFACGPCIGMGQAPPSQGVSVRTMNRNFAGRSGTPDDRVYLSSTETAAACAIRGMITDPRDLGEYKVFHEPDHYPIDMGMFIAPPEDGSKVTVERGPNITPVPVHGALNAEVSGTVLIKLGDNITTDHISPAGAAMIPLRSNIPRISRFVFAAVDPGFVIRAEERGGGLIVAGHNYGQGSSREHAALCPRFLGVVAVIAKSFARIHRQNLLNVGILPLTFANVDDFDRLNPDDQLIINVSQPSFRDGSLVAADRSSGAQIPLRHDLSSRQVEIVQAGGLLNYVHNGSLGT